MKRRIIIFILLLLCLRTVEAQTTLFSNSPLAVMIDDSVTLVREGRVGTIRPSTSDYGLLVYRVSEPIPNTTTTVISSGRTLRCFIPTTAVLTNGSDHDMSVINSATGEVCEISGATRTSATTFSAIGAQLFPISGDGISHPLANGTVYRITASGFATANFGITMEDVADIQAGRLHHGLLFILPANIINGSSTSGYVAPATGAETQGTAGSSGLPMGAMFTLPRVYTVPDGLNIVSAAVLQSIHDYGVMLGDANGAPNYGGLSTGTFRMEPAAQTALGFAPDNPNASCPTHVTSSSLLRCIVQEEVYNEIARVGLWRISNTVVITPTAAPTRTPTRTPTVSITATRTPTRTPSPTFTASPTSLTLTPTLAGTECGLVVSPVVTLTCR